MIQYPVCNCLYFFPLGYRLQLHAQKFLERVGLSEHNRAPEMKENQINLPNLCVRIHHSSSHGTPPPSFRHTLLVLYHWQRCKLGDGKGHHVYVCNQYMNVTAVKPEWEMYFLQEIMNRSAREYLR